MEFFTYSLVAVFAVIGISFFAQLNQRHDSNDQEDNIKQIRQELRLIAYLLAAILCALGVVADKLH
jgi:hypothetical protein